MCTSLKQPRVIMKLASQRCFSSGIHFPHSKIPAKSQAHRFTLTLFDKLWEQYRQRVSYVNVYENIVAQHGASFVNDHVAFRTIQTQSPNMGIASIGRIFEALGYRAKECYQFEDKHLNAIYFQHPEPLFPKIFVSEIRVYELSEKNRNRILKSVSTHKSLLTDELLHSIHSLHTTRSTGLDNLLERALNCIQVVPWALPTLEDVQAVNEESQYAAWVLVHGNNVNHFTALINSHQVETLNDIEKTTRALATAGVPMKHSIEGERGSKLRQTATEAVTIEVPLMQQGKIINSPWTYAYFELAQRDTFIGEGGHPYRYEGFMSHQATNLFEMTRGK